MKATKPATKSAASRAPRKAPAKSVRKSGTPGEFGHLTQPETTHLVMHAQEAFNYQLALKRVEPGTKFDDWRRDQVMAEVELGGISKINRSHYRGVKARFLELAGRDAEALELRLTAGPKSYKPGGPADTWESCEALVHHIRQGLAEHAKFPAESLQGGKGHIYPGWIINAARQRTGKPTLTMDTLAERLDPATLHGLLSHLRNHIATREGRAVPERRAKRVYPPKPDPGSMAEDDPF